VVIGEGVAVVPDERHRFVEGVAVATGATVWKLTFKPGHELCAHDGDDTTVVLLYSGDHHCDRMIGLRLGTGQVRWKKPAPSTQHFNGEESVTAANGQFFNYDGTGLPW